MGRIRNSPAQTDMALIGRRWIMKTNPMCHYIKDVKIPTPNKGLDRFELVPQLLEGHDPDLTEYLHSVYKEARRRNIMAKAVYCIRCKTLTGVTVGDETGATY
jgi:hypothetical protein